jgi:cell division protein FtsB
MNVWVLIYRFAWSLLAILALVGLFYVFYPPVRRIHEMQKKEAKLEEEVRFDEEIVNHLKSKQEKLMNDPRFVEKIAREELGYAKPGETVFKFVDDETTNKLTAH